MSIEKADIIARATLTVLRRCALAGLDKNIRGTAILPHLSPRSLEDLINRIRNVGTPAYFISMIHTDLLMLGAFPLPPEAYSPGPDETIAEALEELRVSAHTGAPERGIRVLGHGDEFVMLTADECATWFSAHRFPLEHSAISSPGEVYPENPWAVVKFSRPRALSRMDFGAVR